jgi:hypothetical protein
MTWEILLKQCAVGRIRQQRYERAQALRNAPPPLRTPDRRQAQGHNMKRISLAVAIIILTILVVGAHAQTPTPPQATENYLFSQGGRPLIIITDGTTVQEQSLHIRISDDKAYVYAYYIACSTVKGQPVLNGSVEMNKTAAYGGYCDYSMMAAPINNLSEVVAVCKMRTGEDITYFGTDGLSGLSQHLDPVKSDCPTLSKKWYGFASTRTGSNITRMPLAVYNSGFITGGWINNKFTFFIVDTGSTVTTMNLAAFSIKPTGSAKFSLANGTEVTQATGTAELCYTGTFGLNVDVSDSPAKTDPLLGMSFLKSFSSVTFNLTDETLDLVVKE